MNYIDPSGYAKVSDGKNLYERYYDSKKKTYQDYYIGTTKAGTTTKNPDKNSGYSPGTVSRSIGSTDRKKSPTGSNSIGYGSVKIDDSLTRTQKVTLKKLNNIINDHLKESDFSGTLRDLKGNPVPKPGGGYYDHKGEMDDALTGLKSVKKSLNGSLKNQYIKPEAREILEDALRKTDYYIEKINDLYNNYDNDSRNGKNGKVYIDDGGLFTIDKNGKVIRLNQNQYDCIYFYPIGPVTPAIPISSPNVVLSPSFVW